MTHNQAFEAKRNVTLVKNSEAVTIFVDAQGKDYKGLSLVARSFAEDISLVTGVKPAVTTDAQALSGTAVIAGSIGNNQLIDALIEQGKLDVSSIQNKRETYQIRVVEQPFPGVDRAVVVIGSDKRGTMYGLYYISEKIGVSPWVYWGDVMPAQRPEIVLSIDQLHVESKEPFIKYRGFFINDEWPSFGSWTMNRFGGFNEGMYDKVFQLILRLKGNYMWPAMWSAVFSENGKSSPIANAELADAYGIVMGTSHHEPMFRSGEEWKNVHRDYTENGEWDFTSNRDAITKFWEDAVIRNKDFESIITLGMRGERDSALGGGIEHNIQLLKDIITTQQGLLEKYGLQDAPQSLVIYKEVEKFWHGTETVPGLKHWDALNNVTIMLSDDNFGNMRTLPVEEERNRAGGFGIYYHFDYHGGPRSYEWVNTIQLEKVWEQMCMAYDYGIHDIWIVNVGDLKPMELPLSYFMDLAYDYEKWGANGINRTNDYLLQWTKQQFGHAVDEDAVKGIAGVLADYTKMNGSRKPEVTYADTYSCANYNEAQRELHAALQLEKDAAKYGDLMPDTHKDAYYQLVYFPAVASANVKKMHIYAGLNQKYSALKQPSVLANSYAELVQETIEADKQLEDYYNNTMSGGKWKGMMSSPHIGYTNWNADGWQYPHTSTITPGEGSLMIVDVEGTNEAYTSGAAELPAFTNLGKEAYCITISNGGKEAFHYSIDTNADWIKIDGSQGNVQTGTTIRVSANWDRLSAASSGELTITGAGQIVKVIVKAEIIDVSDLPAMTFVETHGVASMEAEHFAACVPSSRAEWKRIDHYGRTLSSLKMFPTTVSFNHPDEAPYLEYRVNVTEDRAYWLTAYAAPTNNLSKHGRLRYAVSFDGEHPVTADMLPADYDTGYSRSWSNAVMDNIHTTVTTHSLSKGTHTLRIYGLDAGLVLQKLVLSKGPLPYSYFGPGESYYVGQ